MAMRPPQSKIAPQGFSEPTFSSRPNRSGKKTIIFILILVLLAGVAFYFFTKYLELKENPNAISEAEAMELSLEVGKIMVVPEDEVPTIATVSDPELLKDQAFFRNAKKGDKVLIYTQAGRAILYDPIAKKIIEVAPIDNRTSPEPVETENVTTETASQE